MSTYPDGKRSHTGDTRHDTNDARHRFKQMTGSLVTRIVEGADGSTTRIDEPDLADVQEGNGLLHLSQAWAEQGHLTDVCSNPGLCRCLS